MFTPDSSKGIHLDSVEVIQQGTVPVQIFLKVLGYFPSGCGKSGQTNQRVEGDRFVITMHTAPIPPGTICFQATVPFEKIIPLDVYGLAVGTYEYSVNGEHSGSFTLTQDNHL